MSQTIQAGFTQALGLIGQKADAIDDTVDSKAAQGAIPFGRGVVKGTADDQCTLAVAGGTLLGVALHTHTIVTDGYQDTDTVNVGIHARAVVEAVGTVVAETPAYVVTAVGANQGKFTATATNNLLAGKFKTSGASGSLVVVEIQR